ncbi:hypothetical protein AB0869_27990 [Micromonospora vinacea]
MGSTRPMTTRLGLMWTVTVLLITAGDVVARALFGGWQASLERRPVATDS